CIANAPFPCLSFELSPHSLISSSGLSNMSASFLHFEIRGTAVPLSHFETALSDTPMSLPSWNWDNPLLVRISRIKFPKP
ncbi:MAG: hypothetical protein ACLTAO_05015, partial [Christensenellales bacterium]